MEFINAKNGYALIREGNVYSVVDMLTNIVKVKGSEDVVRDMFMKVR